LQLSCTGRLSLQELVFALAGEGRKIPDSMGAKRIIWTSCMTGKGTAQALKRLIEQELPSEWRSVIEVTPIDILPGSPPSLPSSEGVVAAVGSIDPAQPGVPFLSVEELLAPEGMQRLLCLLENPGGQTKVVTSTAQSDIDGAPLVTYTQSILERELLYANPWHVRTTCLRMAQRLESLVKKTLSPQWRARFLLHMGYVIERAIVHQPVIHPYAAKIQKQFPNEWTILCEAWEEVESVFRLPADVNELAFVFEMVFPDPDYEVLLS